MSRNRDAKLTSVPLFLGVDPGLRRTGYSLLRQGERGPELLEAGVIRSTDKESLAFRVHEIGSGLREVLEEFRPHAMAIEQVFAMPRSPKAPLMMAHARGAILMTAIDFGLEITHYAARYVKSLLTGSGRASKEQVQHAVKTELKLDSILEPNDVADATAMALCLYHSVNTRSRLPA